MAAPTRSAPAAVFARLRAAVRPRGDDYLLPSDQLPERDRAGAIEVARTLADRGPAEARALVESLHAEGRLDAVTRVSALHVIAASPAVRDLAEAARLADLQEYLALDAGGPHLETRLASADRHRGVVAFLMGRPEVALEWFTRAFERQRTAENVGNVLAALIALGDRREAADLLVTVRDRFPPSLVDELMDRIEQDGDLRELR